MRNCSGKDHFGCLPDDIVHLVLNKLLDAKWLCRCSLVSKRFASIIIFHTHTVFARIPRNTADTLDDHDQVAKFCGIPENSAFNFLKKLRAIRSLHIEFLWSSSVVKWSARFGTDLESIVVLLPTSLCKKNPLKNKEEGEDEESEIEIITRYEWMHRIDLAIDCSHDVFRYHIVFLLLLQQHQRLQSLTITDSKKLGKLSVRGERLVELTRLMNLETIVPKSGSGRVPRRLQVGYLPMLDLPLSGFVMNGAVLVLFKLLGGGSDDNAEIIAGALEEEETFGEAVKEILMKYQDRMMDLNDLPQYMALNLLV